MVPATADCEMVVTELRSKFRRCDHQRSQRLDRAVLVVSVIVLAVRHATPAVRYVAILATRDNFPEGTCASGDGCGGLLHDQSGE